MTIMFFKENQNSNHKGGLAWQVEAFMPALKPPASQQAKRRLPPINPPNGRHSQSRRSQLIRQKSVQFSDIVKVDKPNGVNTTGVIQKTDYGSDEEKFKGLMDLNEREQTKVLKMPLSQVGQPQQEQIVDSFRKKIRQETSREVDVQEQDQIDLGEQSHMPWPAKQLMRNDDIGFGDMMKQETVALNFKVEELYERFCQLKRFEIIKQVEDLEEREVSFDKVRGFIRSVRLVQEQYDRLNFVHFVNINQKETLKVKIQKYHKVIRQLLRRTESDLVQYEQQMYELIEDQKRFQLQQDDELLLEWLEKQEDKKRIAQRKKQEILEAKQREEDEKRRQKEEEERKKQISRLEQLKCINENKALRLHANDSDSLLKAYNGEQKAKKADKVVQELLRRKRKRKLRIINRNTAVEAQQQNQSWSPQKPIGIPVMRKGQGLWASTVKDLQESSDKKDIKQYPSRIKLKTEGLSIADFGKAPNTENFERKGVVYERTKDSIITKEKIIAGRLKERLDLNSSMTKEKLSPGRNQEQFLEEGIEFQFV